MKLDKFTKNLILIACFTLFLFVCVSAAFDFGVTKTPVGDANVFVGDVITYIINITNNGTSNIVLVNLNDTFNETYLEFNNSDLPSTSNGTGWFYWNNVLL